MTLYHIEQETQQTPYRLIHLQTNRGQVDCRYHPLPGSYRAALWVPGAIGGWHSPALGLYPRLTDELKEYGIGSLQVKFRNSRDLDEAASDVLAGLEFLRRQNIETAALIGHSFGGAVVIRAAADSELARTVVTLSTQSYGTELVQQLSPECSILIAHGLDDELIPPAASKRVFERAREPKRLLLLKGTNHNLDQAADELRVFVRGWIVKQLPGTHAL